MVKLSRTRQQWIYQHLRILMHVVVIAVLVNTLYLLRLYFFPAPATKPPNIVLYTGNAALILLLLCLAVTPIRRIAGIQSIVALRKPLGLYAFLFAMIHMAFFYRNIFSTFGFSTVMLDWDLFYIYSFGKTRYALAGVPALLLLIPLAVTSNRWSMRRLGKRWKQLHKLVYIAAILAAVHVVWRDRWHNQPLDDNDAYWYAGVLVLLLGIRLVYWWRRRRS